jgi:hypothetical protein
MRSTILFRCALIGLASLPMVAGCQSIRDAAGLTKQSPDEFAVVTKAPLIVPPDFNLHPPSPGAAPLNQQDPTSAAESSLFNSTDPQTVAQGMTGNFTPGEKMLLANAGAQNADPAIRGNMQSDQGVMQGADPAFTNTVLAGTTVPKTRKAVAPPPKKDTGWFDWF